MAAFARKLTRNRLDFFLRMCEAIARAHSRRVIHLDIKPSNIQVEESAELVFLTKPQIFPKHLLDFLADKFVLRRCVWWKLNSRMGNAVVTMMEVGVQTKKTTKIKRCHANALPIPIAVFPCWK